MYFTEGSSLRHSTDLEQDSIKYETIKPELSSINFSSESDIVDYLFSIQDLYVYNPLAYEELLVNLNSFYSLLESIFNDLKNGSRYYGIALSKKHNALNALHSLILKLPPESSFTEKFNVSHERLESILTKKLNDMYTECEKRILESGRDTSTIPLLRGPLGHNVYNDELYSYEFY